MSRSRPRRQSCFCMGATFLGLAKHDVAIPVSQFKLVDKKLVLPSATKEALKAIPEFQYAQ